MSDPASLPHASTCPTCGGPRQSFYVAGYERAEAKYKAQLQQAREALERIAAYGDREPKFLMQNAYVVLAECVMDASAALKGKDAT